MNTQKELIVNVPGKVFELTLPENTLILNLSQTEEANRVKMKVEYPSNYRTLRRRKFVLGPVKPNHKTQYEFIGQIGMASFYEQLNIGN
jgi:hypothetical protein